MLVFHLQRLSLRISIVILCHFDIWNNLICYGHHGDGAFYDTAAAHMNLHRCENLLSVFSKTCDGVFMQYHYLDLWLNALMLSIWSKEATLGYLFSTNWLVLFLFFGAAYEFVLVSTQQRWLALFGAAAVIILSIYPDYIDFHQKPKVLWMTAGLLSANVLWRIGCYALALLMAAVMAIGFLTPVPFLGGACGYVLMFCLRRRGKHIRDVLTACLPALCAGVPFVIMHALREHILEPQISIIEWSAWLVHPYYARMLFAVWPLLMGLYLYRYNANHLKDRPLNEWVSPYLWGICGVLIFVSVFSRVRDIHQFLYNCTLVCAVVAVREACVAWLNMQSAKKQSVAMVVFILMASVHMGVKGLGPFTFQGQCESIDFVDRLDTQLDIYEPGRIGLSLADSLFNVHQDQLFRHHQTQAIAALRPQMLFLKSEEMQKLIDPSDLRYKILDLHRHASEAEGCSPENILVVHDANLDWDKLSFKHQRTLRSEHSGVSYSFAQRSCE